MALLLSKPPKEKLDRPTVDIPDRIVMGRKVESYLKAEAVLAAEETATNIISKRNNLR